MDIRSSVARRDEQEVARSLIDRGLSTDPSSPSRTLPGPRPGRTSPPTPWQDGFGSVAKGQFAEMSRTYGLYGGLATGDEVVWRMKDRWRQPISVLAKWIVGRSIVNVAWRSCFLIPVFQFTPHMGIRTGVSAVLDELASVFDDWEIAFWFAEPNAWLRGERPLDLVSIDDAAITEAARADRFVARADGVQP